MFKRSPKVSDGLDDRIWRRTVEVVEAAHRGDAKAHADEFRGWEADLSIQERRRMELYIRYLLGLWLHNELRGEYQASNLRAIAESIQAGAERVVRVDVDKLLEAFREALDIAKPEDTLRGIALDMIASAALGVLLTKPARQLAEMRPKLAAYYEKWGDRLREIEETG